MQIFFLLKYNFVEIPLKFIIAELSIRKLGSVSVLIMMRLIKNYWMKLSRILRIIQTEVIYIYRFLINKTWIVC